MTGSGPLLGEDRPHPALGPLLRIWVGFRLCRLGTPGVYIACLVVYGVRGGHRHWRERKA